MNWFTRSPRALDPADIQAIAEQAAQNVVGLLERSAPGVYRLLEPKELASVLNVSLDYVYAHASELGAMRLGEGPKARLRFDLQTAQGAMKTRGRSRSPIASRR